MTFVELVELVELVVLGNISDTEMVTVNGGMVSVVVVCGEVVVTLLVLMMTVMVGESKGAAEDVPRATVVMGSSELESWRVMMVTTAPDEMLAPANMETSICYKTAPAE